LEKWGWVPKTSTGEPDPRDHPISAFGQTGHVSERPGFAAVAEAFGASAAGWRS